MCSLRRASDSKTARGSCTVIPHGLLHVAARSATWKSDKIFPDAKDMHLEEPKDKIVGKCQPHGVVGLLLHHIP